jgi:Ca2+/Na+ antiporter
MGLISFQNLANGSAFKMSMLLFIVGTVIFALMSKLRKLFAKDKKRTIIYLIFTLISFALVGVLSSSKVLNDTPLNSFYGFQVLFLILGIVHMYVMRKYFENLSEDKTDFFSEFLFSIAFLLVGLIAFYNVVFKFKIDFSLIFMTAAIVYLIPFLVYRLYEMALQIPIQVYDKWYFPVSEDIKDPTSKELENPLVISFEFQKRNTDSEVTNFRVKAPNNMEFSKLFYFFITDYNVRHPESPIEYLEEDKPQAWIFYFKPNWLSSLRHIDFNKTISWNKIKENTVIICQRTEED